MKRSFKQSSIDEITTILPVIYYRVFRKRITAQTIHSRVVTDSFMKSQQCRGASMFIIPSIKCIYIRRKDLYDITYLDLVSDLAHELLHLYCYTEGVGYYDESDAFKSFAKVLCIPQNDPKDNTYEVFTGTRYTSKEFLKNYFPELYLAFDKTNKAQYTFKRILWEYPEFLLSKVV